jgi:ribonuclease PH
LDSQGAAVTAAQEAVRNPMRARKSVRDAEKLKRQAALLSVQAREATGGTATAVLSSAKQLALRAASRLPAMTLLIWTLLGPAIAGFWKLAAPPAHRTGDPSGRTL